MTMKLNFKYHVVVVCDRRGLTVRSTPRLSLCCFGLHFAVVTNTNTKKDTFS